MITNHLIKENIMERIVLDFDDERSKIFQKKYEEIDFLVLNDYITIEEGNKRMDKLLKEEYRSGFYLTLDGHYNENDNVIIYNILRGV